MPNRGYDTLGLPCQTPNTSLQYCPSTSCSSLPTSPSELHGQNGRCRRQVFRSQGCKPFCNCRALSSVRLTSPFFGCFRFGCSSISPLYLGGKCEIKSNRLV